MGREPIRAFAFSGKGTGAAGYWRDAGTVDTYYAATMDLLADPQAPRREGRNTLPTAVRHRARTAPSSAWTLRKEVRRRMAQS